MARKTLNVVETAYRAVMEEQDDTILWLVAAMQGAGGDHSVAGQGAPGLAVGQWKQTQAPKMDRDVLDLMENRKVPVYVVEEDLAERGIVLADIVPGIRLIARKALSGVFAEYDLVSHW